MASVTPFKVEFPPEKVEDLKDKLFKVSFPDEIRNSGWSDGPPLQDMQRLVAAWQNYDWEKAQSFLNQGDQFTTDVDVEGFGSMKLHFVHRKSANPQAIPLLFAHGWPGNFTEAYKLKRLLEDSEQQASKDDERHPEFHLVAPSLPNFGFSEGAKERGFGLRQYATACHALMQRLGYTQYATQAGDWGFWITRAMGHLYPESVKASHYNMVYAQSPKWTSHPLLALKHAVTPYTSAEREGLERTKWFKAESQGYNLLQSSKPQTLGYGLTDSPVALLAWIYEKMHDWSDDYPWTDDEVLLWVNLYYFSTAGPAAPQRIYYEVTHEKDGNFTYRAMLKSTPASVKLGLTHNPKELEIFPRLWGRTLGNVVFEEENLHGGHFYAHEHPEWLLRDLRRMFGREGGAYAVVENRHGY